jgi:hypothetical protein
LALPGVLVPSPGNEASPAGDKTLDELRTELAKGFGDKFSL